METFLSYCGKIVCFVINGKIIKNNLAIWSHWLWLDATSNPGNALTTKALRQTSLKAIFVVLIIKDGGIQTLIVWSNHCDDFAKTISFEAFFSF